MFVTKISLIFFLLIIIVNIKQVLQMAVYRRFIRKFNDNVYCSENNNYN